MKRLGLFATLVAGSFLAIACSHNEPAQQQSGPNYTPTATTPPAQHEMQPVSGSDQTGQPPGTGTTTTPSGSTTVQPPANSPNPNPSPTYPSGGTSTGTYQPNTGTTTGTTPGMTPPSESATGKGDAGTKGADGGTMPKK